MVPLRSVPPWLESLVGPVRHGRAAMTRGGVVLEFEPTATSQAGGGEVGRDRRVKVRLLPTGAAEVRRAGQTRRVSVDPASAAAWIARLEHADRWFSGESPIVDPDPVTTALLADLERLEPPLGDRGGPDGPGDATIASGSVVDVLLGLACGRWTSVRDREPVEQAAEVLRAGALGRVDAMRRLGLGAASGGAMALVTSAAFELFGHEAAAERFATEGLRHHYPVAHRAGIYLRLARLAMRAGERAMLEDGDDRAAESSFDRAVQWCRAAVLIAPEDPGTLLVAADRLAKCGAFDDSVEVLRDLVRPEAEVPPRDRATARARLAHVELWRGRDGHARSHLDALLELGPAASPVEVATLQGILELRAGALSRAETLLRAALSIDPDDPEAGLFLTEVLVRQGRYADAVPVLERSRARTQTPAHRTIKPAVYGMDDRAPAECAAAALAELDAFAGNRGPVLTRATAGPNGAPHLAIVRFRADERVGPRNASAGALKRIRFESVDEVLGRFESLARRYPTSPHPRCYRGELWLWLGELDRAYADFEAAGRARWAFVGRGAVHVLRDEPDRAEAEFDACARAFSPIPGATTHVFRGENLRRSGDVERAIVELDTALTVKRDRVSAWINLALCHHALAKARAPAGATTAGREPETSLDSIVDRLERRHPVLLSDAAAEAGVDDGIARLETALAMMRGNRSSHLMTYFVGDGTMRIAQDSERWTELARRNATYARSELRNRVVDRVLSP